MKLLRQTSLFKRDGERLLIYEIDLCEVGREEFVVNFRQGRQGRALKDGTKTIMPVDRRRADHTFDQLVAKLEEQGYSTARPGPAMPAPIDVPRVVEPPPTARTRLDARRLEPWKQALLSRLRNDGGGQPLDRVIWRVGQRRLREALPRLLDLLDRSRETHTARRRQHTPAVDSTLRRRTLAAAIARVAHPDDAAALMAPLTALRGDADPVVARMGEEGLLAILDPAALAAHRAQLRGELPMSVAQAEGRALVRALDNGARDTPRAFAILYMLDEPAGRAALLTWLAEATFQPPNVRIIRDLYKRAELRDDGEIWGLIAWRMEYARGNGSYGRWDNRERRYITWAELVREPNNTRYAWGNATKRYFRRRTWRTLNARGLHAQSEAFCSLATGYLKRFTEQQAGPEGLGAWALGRLLHRSSGVEHDARRLTHWGRPRWDDHRPAHARCWQTCPDRLIELILEAQSSIVATIALRQLRNTPAAWSKVPLDRLLMLIGMDRPEVVSIAIEMAIGRFDAQQPNHALVGAIATCTVALARHTAHGWLRANPARFVGDAALIQQLIACEHEDTRAVAVELVERATPTIRDALTRTIVAAVGAAPGAAVEQLLRGAVERGLLGPTDLLALLERAPLLAARLALADHRRPDDALVAELLKHPESAVRALGVDLLGRLPDHVLTQRYAVLVHLCTHADPAVRAAIRPIIGRLAGGSPTFADSIVASLIEILRQPEVTEGAHEDLVQLIQQGLPAALARIDTDQLLRLAQSTSAAVSRLVTAPILALAPSAIPLESVAQLADHPSVEIRRKAWQMARARQRELQAAPDQLLRLVDAEWADARAFAFAFIEEAFTALEPTVLVGLCDSVRPDVQHFGQRMINRLFADADGATYLRMLSQHPAPGVQLFVTNLLSRYADSPERLIELEPYFMVVLCSVHRGKVAKARVIAFLRDAGLRDATSAAIVARIFAHVSASAQVQLHAAAVEALVAIRAKWPRVEVPLRTIEPAFRGARAV